MPDALSSIGGALGGAGGGGLGGLLKLVTTGFGLVSNIMATQQQQSALNRISSYQKNPAKAAQVINSLTQPLSLGLTEDVGNNVQGYLAERGLSGSPNITSSVLAQALAPYQQQNQQQAMQEFQMLLNPTGAGFQQPQSLQSLMSLFKPAPGLAPPGGAQPAGGSSGNPGPQPYPYGGADPNAGGSGSGITDSPLDPMAIYS